MTSPVQGTTLPELQQMLNPGQECTIQVALLANSVTPSERHLLLTVERIATQLGVVVDWGSASTDAERAALVSETMSPAASTPTSLLEVPCGDSPAAEPVLGGDRALDATASAHALHGSVDSPDLTTLLEQGNSDRSFVFSIDDDSQQELQFFQYQQTQQQYDEQQHQQHLHHQHQQQQHIQQLEQQQQQQQQQHLAGFSLSGGPVIRFGNAPMFDGVREALSSIIDERNSMHAYERQMEWAAKVKVSSRTFPRHCCWWSLDLSRPCTYGKDKRPVVFKHRKRARRHEYLCTQHLDQERKAYGSRYTALIEEQLKEREETASAKQPTPPKPRTTK